MIGVPPFGTVEYHQKYSQYRSLAGDPDYVGCPRKCLWPGCDVHVWINGGGGGFFCCYRPGDPKGTQGCWDKKFPIEWRMWLVCRPLVERGLAARAMVFLALRWNMGDEDDDGADFPGVECTGETQRAIFVTKTKDCPGGSVPKSVIHDNSDVFKKGDKGKLVLKTWWAEKSGWL